MYYSVVLVSYAFNCPARTFALTAYSLRTLQDENIHSHTSPNQKWNFTEAIPGTLGAISVDEVCGPVPSVKPPIRRIAEVQASAQWEPLTTFNHAEEGPTRLELDGRSLRPLSNKNVASIVRSTPTRGIINGVPYRYQLIEMHVNCANRQVSISAYVYFSSADSVLLQDDIDASRMKWQVAPAHSLAERVVGRSCGAGASVERTTPAAPSSGAFGTAWLAEGGYVITAYHVVEGASRLTLVLGSKRRIAAKVITVDVANDIAILEADFGANRPRALPLSRSGAGLGARVFTLGFPHPKLLGTSPKLTAGEISSVSGLSDDPRTMQISVPVQSGNSGGPLINLNGEVVGLVSAKLSATNVLRRTGDLTQNVNYAVKGRYVAGLLSDVAARNALILQAKAGRSLEELVSEIQDSVFIVVAE